MNWVKTNKQTNKQTCVIERVPPPLSHQSKTHQERGEVFPGDLEMCGR
jgi:hypothetical protein